MLLKKYVRGIFCVCLTLHGLLGFGFDFYFNDYKSVPGFETQNLTGGFWPLLSEVLKAALVWRESIQAFTPERLEPQKKVG